MHSRGDAVQCTCTAEAIRTRLEFSSTVETDFKQEVAAEMGRLGNHLSHQVVPHPLAASPTHWLTHLLSQSLAASLTRCPTVWLTRCLTHSLPHHDRCDTHTTWSGINYLYFRDADRRRLHPSMLPSSDACRTVCCSRRTHRLVGIELGMDRGSMRDGLRHWH